MQCPSCRAVFSNGLEICPRCKTPALTSSAVPAAQPSVSHGQEETMGAPAFVAEESNGETAVVATTATTVSTLIEFPGSGKRPQWRKQLSERVREIQERRAREAEEAARQPAHPPIEPPAQQLGLVPPQDIPQINPLVAAALRRIERAHQSPLPSPRASRSGGAATAAARIIEDEYQTEATLLAPLEAQASVPLPKPDKPSEVARERGLVVVSQPQTANRTEVVSDEAPHRRVAAAKVIDDTVIESLEAEASILPAIEPYDDRAALHRRVLAGIIDIFVVAFASSPFAAIIELTNGNWADMRVAASMGGIILVIMFLYLTASTALSGRTWGMSLLSLRPVDSDTGLPPTTKQSVSRAILFMASLALLGLGVLYALFDAEGRTAHDYFSGTVVVHE